MKADNYIPDNKGVRYDEGKTQFHLLPSDGISELAKVYMFGARKYSAYNWERGMAWSRCFNSLLRHLYAYWDGEERDAETGLHHMAHAAWNALALLVYSLRGIGTDDRKASFLSAQQNHAAAELPIGCAIPVPYGMEIRDFAARELPPVKENSGMKNPYAPKNKQP